MSNDAEAVLVDVRTKAEWSFVGLPDLSALGREVVCREWQHWPDMARDPDFAPGLLDEVGRSASRYLFICRSGMRSMQAARAVAEVLATEGRRGECLNVAEGFEGDLDEDAHRGGLNGWKARGLDWRQS
ncbi:rhodanese-like domain-containing protein [uncultured Jannaschia sp.]|uniref:rhodanese-like domain-containing protein n=1 Tax=uncultured Jannaschia sp. TaxID=293347 RepID=UPI002618B25E|nr:rhodanese-like domain-containing protein [uncultured Jannaschia sp.]